MRMIKIGGKSYPIKATLNVDAALTRRQNEIIMDARSRAEDEIAEKRAEAADAGKEYSDEVAEALIERRMKTALQAYVSDAENSLWQIAQLINEAVAYEATINGVDIAATVPGYPLTAQKIGMMATVADLNAPEMQQAVAEELVECRGGDPKNVDAGKLLEIGKKIF